MRSDIIIVSDLCRIYIIFCTQRCPACAHDAATTAKTATVHSRKI